MKTFTGASNRAVDQVKELSSYGASAVGKRHGVRIAAAPLERGGQAGRGEVTGMGDVKSLFGVSPDEDNLKVGAVVSVTPLSFDLRVGLGRAVHVATKRGQLDELTSPEVVDDEEVVELTHAYAAPK
jgi:hypothetical protein